MDDRILSMSAFEAAYLVRAFRLKNPGLNDNELIETARAIRADFYSYDYKNGLLLENVIACPGLGTSLENFFKCAVETVIAHRQPFWIRLAPSGRSHVVQAMGVDGAQCLRAAGLMDDSERATAWWDDLSRASRSQRDERLLLQGREGERLSIAYENNRLEREGIMRKPVWVAINDNTVGYDILSYSVSNGKEHSRLIEVKTSVGFRPRMFLSRNEWQAAEDFGVAFEFHHWQIGRNVLSIFSVEDIRPHVPRDNNHGFWRSVDIYL